MSLNVYVDSREVRCKDVLGLAAGQRCREVAPCGPGTRVCGLQIGADEFSYFTNGIVRYTPTRMPLFELAHKVALGQCHCGRSFVAATLDAMEEAFEAITFDWEARNSRHFVGTFAQALLGTKCPKWIDRMASRGDLAGPAARARERDEPRGDAGWFGFFGATRPPTKTVVYDHAPRAPPRLSPDLEEWARTLDCDDEPEDFDPIDDLDAATAAARAKVMGNLRPHRRASPNEPEATHEIDPPPPPPPPDRDPRLPPPPSAAGVVPPTPSEAHQATAQLSSFLDTSLRRSPQ